MLKVCVVAYCLETGRIYDRSSPCTFDMSISIMTAYQKIYPGCGLSLLKLIPSPEFSCDNCKHECPIEYQANQPGCCEYFEFKDGEDL